MKNNLKYDLNNYAKSLKREMIDESHFYDFRQNIFGKEMDERFEKMFLEGDGNELVSKACAVHSSSMLGYNFFHWISKDNPLTFRFPSEDNTKKENEIKYTSVLFEVKIRVLKGRARPANMDIVLTNENKDVLFIESKFLEYLVHQDFSISESYNRNSSYYCSGEQWVDFINEFIKLLKNNKERHYWDGIKQEICHMIGLNNWAKQVDIEKPIIMNDKIPSFDKANDIHFINLVFEPNTKYQEEHKAFTDYKKRYEYLQGLEKEFFPRKIKMHFMSYSEIWPYIQAGICPKLEDYLRNRYINFAEL